MAYSDTSRDHSAAKRCIMQKYGHDRITKLHQEEETQIALLKIARSAFKFDDHLYSVAAVTNVILVLALVSIEKSERPHCSAPHDRATVLNG